MEKKNSIHNANFRYFRLSGRKKYAFTKVLIIDRPWGHVK